MTEASIQALKNLRKLDTFEWYLVPLLAFVIFAYSLEARRGEWGRVLTGIGFFAGELIWEMFNALILKFSGYSALWTVSGKSVYLLFVGLNIEIALMFALAPLALFNFLPEDRNQKILGVSNRILIPVLFGLFCVFVEVLLNQWGALTWAYRWWSFPHVWLIITVYVTPFLLIVRYQDRVSLKAKKWGALLCAASALVLYLLLVPVLGWI